MLMLNKDTVGLDQGLDQDLFLSVSFSTNREKYIERTTENIFEIHGG